MAGKLIFVSGLAGAGKTTLVGEALRAVDNLEFLRTYTTRLPRVGEQNSYEYVFVTEDEYERLKSQSRKWDETIYNGYKYASDAEKFIADLQNGLNIIVSVTPNIDDIHAMAEVYGKQPITVWIDTPRQVTLERTHDDPQRSHRAEDESVKEFFGKIFVPTNSLAEDSVSFIALIRSLIEQE